MNIRVLTYPEKLPRTYVIFSWTYAFEYQKPSRKWNKGIKNEMYQTRDKLRDSEHNIIGLVTSHALSTVECSEADSWIIDSGVNCHICNDRQYIYILGKPQDVMNMY